MAELLVMYRSGHESRTQYPHSQGKERMADQHPTIIVLCDKACKTKVDISTRSTKVRKVPYCISIAHRRRPLHRQASHDSARVSQSQPHRNLIARIASGLLQVRPTLGYLRKDAAADGCVMQRANGAEPLGWPVSSAGGKASI